MRIMWSIHLYPPYHNCGAEYVAHHVNKYLLSKGHEVRVLNLQSKGDHYTFEGVDVITNIKSFDPFHWPDVILTHLDFTKYTMNVARVMKKPVVHFVHNSSKYPEIAEANNKQYVVYNAKWIRDALNYSHQSMVLYPPCPMGHYKLEMEPINNEHITLINLNENKGGLILLKLAKTMPDYKFLGVIGSYDDGGMQPAIVDELRAQPNVTVVDHSSDVKAIYRKTRILLVPSRYESWGRVATEAMINGIPVIACPTQGLLENCQHGALFVNPRGEKTTDIYGDITSHDGNSYDISLFKYFIKSLDDPNEYLKRSQLGILRAQELETEYQEQIIQLEKFLYYAKQDYKN